MSMRARALRKRATPQEVKVWRWLRDRRFAHWKFRRQHPIGPYIVDFFCVELQLAIELDGAGHQHPAAAAGDRERTRWLNSQGVELLRLPNRLVDHDARTAGDTILWAIEQRVRRRA